MLAELASAEGSFAEASAPWRTRSGIGTYQALGRFANLWTVTFDHSGTACSVLRMWNNEL
jgi:hypothetical protein